VSLFQVLARSMDMIGGIFRLNMHSISGLGDPAAYWEGQVALESDVAQLRRGDLDALSALLTRYQNRLYRYLLRLVREPAEAEDLFQQTWLRVAEKIRQYDPRRNFEAWLFTLARNLAIDHLRRIRPESLDQPAADTAGESAAARLPSRERPAIEGILARERAGRLDAALERLRETLETQYPGENWQ
jgi:RNA polymerase sigma factor (sigma-70 family)